MNDDITPEEIAEFERAMDFVNRQIRARGKVDRNWIEPFWIEMPNATQFIRDAVSSSLAEHWKTKKQHLGKIEIERRYKDPNPQAAPNFRGMA